MNIGIYGYGNLGKGVEQAIYQNEDAALVGIFTNREPSSIKPFKQDAKVYSTNNLDNFIDKIDVLIICSGSANDTPKISPELVKNFNIVDSFDNHAKIFEHFNNVNKNAIENNHTALISAGWDPGLFSNIRVLLNAFLPNGKDYTFWGKGVSQGHSEAIRHIEGVKDAIQYTVPIDDALNKAKQGSIEDFSIRQKHKRECFVVVEENADKQKIKEQIINMPNYFEPYDTEVNFISMEELNEKHKKLPHGGHVIRNGFTGINNNTKQTIDFHITLESNPEFTANILVAYARAIKRMYDNKDFGCKTVLDIPPALLCKDSKETLMKKMI